MPSPSLTLLRTQSDDRLVALAREGHERAFEAIIERYRKSLLRAARRVLPEGRAEDALQQGLLKAWTALQRGDEVRELRPWLYRIVHHTALNTLRGGGLDYAELHEAIQIADGSDEELERRALMRQTLASLAALPERQREAADGDAAAGGACTGGGGRLPGGDRRARGAAAARGAAPWLQRQAWQAARKPRRPRRAGGAAPPPRRPEHRARRPLRPRQGRPRARRRPPLRAGPGGGRRGRHDASGDDGGDDVAEPEDESGDSGPVRAPLPTVTPTTTPPSPEPDDDVGDSSAN